MLYNIGVDSNILYYRVGYIYAVQIKILLVVTIHDRFVELTTPVVKYALPGTGLWKISGMSQDDQKLQCVDSINLALKHVGI